MPKKTIKKNSTKSKCKNCKCHEKKTKKLRNVKKNTNLLELIKLYIDGVFNKILDLFTQKS